jgi:hypothetical protein
MGPLFVLFGWLVILVLLGLGMAIVFAIFYPIYRFGKAHNFKVVKLIGGIPLILIGLIPIALISLVIFGIGEWIVFSACPSYAFRSTFGFSAASETAPLHSFRSQSTDWQEVFLKFKTRQNIVNKITEKNFQSVSREKFMLKMRNLDDSTPVWFKPTQFYESDRFDDRFSSNSAILCFNETSGICYFHYIGVD